MINVGIVGGTGYTGIELLRLLSQHPQVRLQLITSRSDQGRWVADCYPSLRNQVNLCFVAPDVEALKRCDVVFFATPNGTAMQMAPQLLAAGCRIIDLAADFRLADPDLWAQWYEMPHACPELLTQAVYGLPELHRQAICNARLIANPGCYPTATLLGFLPLLQQGVIQLDNLIVDAKSGVSGAGRQAKVSSLFSEVGEGFKAYAVPGHRHWPEIRQILQQVAASPVGLTFVPHLVPMIRGIEATLYATLTTDLSGEALQQRYEDYYAKVPFVDVMPLGSHPDTNSVKGSNMCRIAVHRPQQGRQVVILSVIDNLVKGAAGQAVQNMNLMFGYPETQGLTQVALTP